MSSSFQVAAVKAAKYIEKIIEKKIITKDDIRTQWWDHFQKNNAVITGSIVVKGLAGDKWEPGNIDIWINVNDVIDINMFYQLFYECGYWHMAKSIPEKYTRVSSFIEIVHTFMKLGEMNIQIIIYRGDIRQVIRAFDISITQFMFKRGEGVKDIGAAYDDLINKRFVITDTLQSIDEWRRTLTRMIKYTNRGFRFDKEKQLTTIIKTINLAYKKDNIDILIEIHSLFEQLDIFLTFNDYGELDLLSVKKDNYSIVPDSSSFLPRTHYLSQLCYNKIGLLELKRDYPDEVFYTCVHGGSPMIHIATAGGKFMVSFNDIMNIRRVIKKLKNPILFLQEDQIPIVSNIISDTNGIYDDTGPKYMRTLVVMDRFHKDERDTNIYSNIQTRKLLATRFKNIVLDRIGK